MNFWIQVLSPTDAFEVEIIVKESAFYKGFKGIFWAQNIFLDFLLKINTLFFIISYRDLNVKKNFDRHPLLWNILELVASGKKILSLDSVWRVKVLIDWSLAKVQVQTTLSFSRAWPRINTKETYFYFNPRVIKFPSPRDEQNSPARTWLNSSRNRKQI